VKIGVTLGIRTNIRRRDMAGNSQSIESLSVDSLGIEDICHKMRIAVEYGGDIIMGKVSGMFGNTQFQIKKEVDPATGTYEPKAMSFDTSSEKVTIYPHIQPAIPGLDTHEATFDTACSSVHERRRYSRPQQPEKPNPHLRPLF
jgi:hypothetical protein